jgi:hypothetical protein
MSEIKEQIARQLCAKLEKVSDIIEAVEGPGIYMELAEVVLLGMRLPLPTPRDPLTGRAEERLPTHEELDRYRFVSNWNLTIDMALQ